MQDKKIKALSIKQIYAERIIAGTKKIELRKRSIGMGLGDLVLLYETSPNSVIRGGFIAGNTISLSPAEMWNQYHQIMGVDKGFYDDYFKDREFAYGTLIQKSFSFTTLSLEQIQRRCLGFVPPQTTINWRKSWDISDEWLNALSQI
jgi:predicted transcriptional regulator